MKAYGLRYNGNLVSTDLKLKKKDWLLIAEEIAKYMRDCYESFSSIEIKENTIIAYLRDRRYGGDRSLEFELVKFKIK